MYTQNPLDNAMNHMDLVAGVLADIGSVPEAPTKGRYLNLGEANAIVEDTILHSRRSGSAQEYEYLKGHRHRLAESLTMIPKAESEEASCLDIGCYGYMAFWAWRYLGYAKVEGIEMRPGEPAEIVRDVEINSERLTFRVHNFDISQPEWPLHGTFDTLLFFETLEHVTQDPSGVMLNVTKRMTPVSTLVISVPNAVSYKTLQEFMTGAPPWTYWFFQPDLTHEPRHSFEYTPIFFKILMRSAGLDELAFRTMTTYVEQDSIKDYVEIGRALSVEPRMFGETMIAQARKVTEEPLFRYPDCIYDSERYYKTTYPLLRPGLDAALDAFLQRSNANDAHSREMNERINASVLAEKESNERASAAVQAEKVEIECASAAVQAEKVAHERASAAVQAEQEANERASAAVQAEKVANECASAAVQAGIVASERASAAFLAEKEALFLCDIYRTKLDTAELDLRAAEERAQQAEERAQQAEERALDATFQHDLIVRSASWRATGPLRRALDRLRSFAQRHKPSAVISA